MKISLDAINLYQNDDGATVELHSGDSCKTLKFTPWGSAGELLLEQVARIILLSFLDDSEER